MLRGVSSRRCIGGIAAIGALALVPFALAGGGDRTIKSQSFIANPNNTTSNQIKCDNGSQVSGGGNAVSPIADNDNPTRIMSLFPVGDLKWILVIHDLQATPRDAKNYVVCRKGHKLETVSNELPVDGMADQNPHVVAKCPKGSSVTGGGGASTGSYNQMFILESRPKGDRGWYVRAFVAGTHVGELGAYAICDPDGANEYETAKRTTVEIRRGARRGVVSELHATAKCPDGAETSGGGYATTESDVNKSVIENRPKGDSKWLGRVRTYNTNQAFTAYARCLLG